MRIIMSDTVRSSPRDFRVLNYEAPYDVETVVRMEDIASIVADEEIKKRLEEISFQAVQV